MISRQKERHEEEKRIPRQKELVAVRHEINDHTQDDDEGSLHEEQGLDFSAEAPLCCPNFSETHLNCDMINLNYVCLQNINYFRLVD